MNKEYYEKNIYGWDMRIMQCEEDIFNIQKRREEFIKIRHGLKQELKRIKEMK